MPIFGKSLWGEEEDTDLRDLFEEIKRDAEYLNGKVENGSKSSGLLDFDTVPVSNTGPAGDPGLYGQTGPIGPIGPTGLIGPSPTGSTIALSTPYMPIAVCEPEKKTTRTSDETDYKLKKEERYEK